MRIGVVTTTRAEYGLLTPLMKRIVADEETELVLIVTGTHLLEEYGKTVKYIEQDGFVIDLKVPVVIETNSPEAISRTMGNYFMGFAGVFENLKLDYVVVLGDRYEMIPICFCATNARIPIAHISGGEITAGAIDDMVRHCVTKMSHLHFPACETYRKRIIQLGENPATVFNVGDLGVENIKKMNFMNKEELEERFGFANGSSYFMVVFHPITLDERTPEDQIHELLSAIENIDNVNFLIMKANADLGGGLINRCLEQFVEKYTNCKLFSSLRYEEFLSLQRFSIGLIGNSSSGIVETPCLGIPTINIGDRQKGRLMAESIISCRVDRNEIKDAIDLAMTEDFRERARRAVNPYGTGETSLEILRHIKNAIKNNDSFQKMFYDI